MIITRENYMDAGYDVFRKFSTPLAVAAAGGVEDFGCLTLGWGMMGTIWGYPAPALTIYVSPARQTFEYLQRNDYFTVSFFPEAYHEDVMLLGQKSGRDGNKVALTRLTPRALEHGVGFAQAELTFVCRKLCAQQFDLAGTPEYMQKGLYTRIPPHYMYIGAVEDAFGEVK